MPLDRCVKPWTRRRKDLETPETTDGWIIARKLIHLRDEANTQHCTLPHSQADENAAFSLASWQVTTWCHVLCCFLVLSWHLSMDEVCGAINGIDDPCWGIC